MLVVFSDEVIERVWQNGKPTPSNDPGVWRKDQCDAWIRRSAYGDRDSPYGWEVDHIRPTSEGGSDELSNLRPLHWENNAVRQSGPLSCVVTSDGNRNVRVR